MITMMRFRSLLIAVLTGSSLLASSAVAAEWDRETLRREALERPRLAIADDDGLDAINFPLNLAATRENFWKQRLDKVKGTRLDTLCYTPFTNSTWVTTRSRIADIYTGRPHDANNRNRVADFHAQGTDPLEMASEFCRKNGMEIFVSLRVNDVHDAWMPRLRSPYKQAHPELLLRATGKPRVNGEGVAFDFTHAENRERIVSLLEEMMERYDVDGIVLDFMRFPIFFPSTYEGNPATDDERTLMTGMIRKIRQAADRIGRRRGRYFLFGVRVFESPEACRAIGLDIETWLRQQLVDLVFAGSDWERFSPVSAMIALGKRYGAKVYASVDVSWLKARPPFQRGFLSALGQGAAAFAAGADGIYYFNYFCTRSGLKQLAEFPRRPEEFAGKNKDYFLQYNHMGTLSIRNIRSLQRTPRFPLFLSAARTIRFPLEIGENFHSPDVLALRPSVRLNVQLCHRESARLGCRINGSLLGECSAVDGICSFQVPPQLIRAGVNEVELFEPEKGSGRQHRTILRGDAVLKYGENQFPWRRLFRAADRKTAERVVDGALRLADTGSGKNQMCNLFYPFHGFPGGLLEIGFELKVESSDSPDAVAVRIADEKHVELVTFEPEKISFQYAGRSIWRHTADRFHAYKISLKNGRIRLSMDGQPLLDAAAGAKVEDPAVQLHPPVSFLECGRQSLFIGSLSESGTGVSLWRNVTAAVVPIEDVGLSVRYAGAMDPELVHAENTTGRLLFSLLPENGMLSPVDGMQITYHPERMRITPENTLLLDNRDAARSYAYCRYRNRSALESGTGVLRLKWRARIPEMDASSPHSMMVSLRAGAPGKIYAAAVRLAQRALQLPDNRNVSLDLKEFHSFELLINCANGRGILRVDGKKTFEFTCPVENQHGTFIGFGDGSGAIAGVCEVAEFSAEIVPVKGK